MTRKMIVIGIAGPARAGKDTAADHLMKRHALVKASFADPLKRMLRVGLGLTEAQLYGDQKETVDPYYGKSGRFMAQTIGTEWGRSMIHPDVWVLAMKRHMEDSFVDGTYHTGFVIPDVRFENEAQFIREHGTLIHLRRTDRAGIDNAGHCSEVGVEVNDCDTVINNDQSIDHLHALLDGIRVA